MRIGLPIPVGGDNNDAMGALNEYRVNQESQLEILYAPLYDTLTYALAGQAVLNFFQVQNGQGGKTLADTNMTLAGQLPAPQAFLVTGISLDLVPPALPGRAVIAATGVATNINDLYEVMTGAAWLNITVGTKPQITEGMLGKFVSSWGLKAAAALALAGEVADKCNIVDYATTCGEPYNVVPFVIPSTQNFSLTINTPTVIGITAASRLQATLHGYLYRAVQ